MLRDSLFSSAPFRGVSHVVRENGRLMAWTENGFNMKLQRNQAGAPVSLTATAPGMYMRTEFELDEQNNVIEVSGDYMPSVMSSEITSAASSQASSELQYLEVSPANGGTANMLNSGNSSILLINSPGDLASLIINLPTVPLGRVVSIASNTNVESVTLFSSLYATIYGPVGQLSMGDCFDFRRISQNVLARVLS